MFCAHFTAVRQLIFAVVVVHLFVCFWWRNHTYVTQRQPLSCLPRQTDKLEVNHKLSKDEKLKSHQSSKSHDSINIALRVTTNETTAPSYCDWQLPWTHSPWVQQPMFSPSCLAWPSLWISTVTLMPKWPSETSKASKAADIFSCISPGCHSILHDTEWQSWHLRHQADLLNSWDVAATQR